MIENKIQSNLIVSVSGVRGIVGESLTIDVAYQYGYAFGRHCQGQVIVGRDSRPSGVNLKKAVIHGLVDAACQVIDVDIAATPTIEMTVLHQKARGGVIITASHNPSEWNGLKFLRSDGTFLRQPEIKKIFSSVNDRRHIQAPRIDTIKILDGAIDYHVDKIVGLVDKKKIQTKRFSVALDTVNGAGGEIALKLLSELDCRVLSINTEMHGNFAHWPEPTPANLQDFSKFVAQSEVEIGFALDPDADRLVLVNSTGKVLNEEYTLALAVQHFLTNIKKGLVVINEMSSRINEDIVKSFNCDLIRAPVGEINVVQAMVDHQAIIGGEGNGGIIDPRIHYGRDGLVGIALILEYLALSTKSINQLVDDLPKYFLIKEKLPINEDLDLRVLIHQLKQKFADAIITETDGIRFTWPDRWLQVRLSNTEPIIRIFAEAPTKRDAEKLVNQVKKFCKCGQGES